MTEWQKANDICQQLNTERYTANPYLNWGGGLSEIKQQVLYIYLYIYIYIYLDGVAKNTVC